MGKRKGSSHRSQSTLPKGLPHKRSKHSAKNTTPSTNPFEVRANKRLKHAVLNRYVSGAQKNSTSATLAKSLTNRQSGLKQVLESSKKRNSFRDGRLGQSQKGGIALSEEEAGMRRLVKERARRSKRSSRYALEEGDDDEEGG
eukprot:CAMPEP_0194378814 /NCGR_PEP_ID=MMETSP0174-20130528/37110_1 /TAXON_ID=216777 /ORGANISM="Proboscia alata, Strain PI-D3" /LENGTH=142 /DNA_ID=CAMNT_0039161097 /DNA_START=31 /DNA_END=455 /DNA_ORIENTATION=+